MKHALKEKIKWQLVNWHHHMKDHVDIGHLTKYDAFRMNGDQATNLEIYASKSILLKFFMISVILFKISKKSGDFHLIVFQIEGA